MGWKSSKIYSELIGLKAQNFFSSRIFCVSISIIAGMIECYFLMAGKHVHLFLFTIGIPVLFLGFSFPLIGILLSFSLMNSFFDLLPRQLFEDTTINKFWDFGFITMCIFSVPLLLKKWQKLPSLPFYIKGFSYFLIICSISFILTFYKYAFPFLDTVKTFRYYLGYLFFIIVIIALMNNRESQIAFKRLLIILYYVSFILITLYNIQFLIQRPLFLGYIGEQTTTYGVTYLRSIPNFLFLCYFFLFYNISAWLLNIKLLPFGVLFIILCLSATLFTFTRGLYISVFMVLGTLFYLIITSGKYNLTKILLFSLYSALIILIFSGFGYLRPFIDRASTIRNASSISEQNDTLSYRISLVEDRINLISRKDPFFGLGFVHNRYGYKFGTFIGNFDESINGSGLDSGDIAWANIIYQTGWVGYAFFSFFIVSLVYYITVTFRKKFFSQKSNIDNLILLELSAILELLCMVFLTVNGDSFTGSTQNTALIFSISCFSNYLQTNSLNYNNNENFHNNTIIQSM
jgi:hypothetical protein